MQLKSSTSSGIVKEKKVKGSSNSSETFCVKYFKYKVQNVSSKYARTSCKRARACLSRVDTFTICARVWVSGFSQFGGCLLSYKINS